MEVCDMVILEGCGNTTMVW